MNDSKARPSTANLAIRWIARIWSLASVGFVLLMVVGELLYPHAPPPSAFSDLVGLFVFPFGTCVGMILAWRWEGVGGGITVGSFLAFYAVLRVIDGRFPRGPYFALVAAPGIFFLLSWAVAGARKKERRLTSVGL